VVKALERRNLSKVGRHKDVLSQISASSKFVDDEFPATAHSVGALSESSRVMVGTGFEIEWRRATDVFSKDLRLFDGGADPHDVRQGSLGNCYFLCALAAIAKKPHRISNLFSEAVPGQFHSEHAALQKNGLYGIKLCAHGGWEEVIVDDLIPCFKNTNEPCFAKSHGRKELWAILLEKAYAKIHGSYESISEGYAGEALADILGAPYKGYALHEGMSNAELHKLWGNLVSFDDDDFVMCCKVPETESNINLEETVGLVDGHAYSVITVLQLSNGDRVLGLRNPWGAVEWTGAYSDDWSGWTEQLRMEAAMHFVKHKDFGRTSLDHAVHSGSFWIKLEDFVRYFDDICVCFFRDHWCHNSLLTELNRQAININTTGHAEGTFHFTFHVPKKMKGMIQVCQDKNVGEPVPVRFCVMKDRVPMGGTSELYFPSATLCCHDIDFKRGEHEIRLQILEPDPSKLIGGLPVVVVVYTEFGIRKLRQVDPSCNGSDFILPENVDHWGHCSLCHHVLTSNARSAQGKKFCYKCWVCQDCHEPITGKFRFRNERPQCVNCAKSKRMVCGVKGAGCGQAITGRHIKALGATWHRDCFKCSTCHGDLSHGFVLQNARPYCCEAHFPP